MRVDAEGLLAWYDANHRDLPWRVSPFDRARGVAADPYRVWLSEIMLQQTTVAAVIDYFHAFTERWPDVHALAATPIDEVLAAWAGLGYYARARNLHKCAVEVSRQRDGVFPDTEADLRDLPGIGAYTAAAIAAIAFDKRAVVVDGNVERVMSRIHAVTEPLPASKPTLKSLADDLTPDQRPGDYAQAVMDLGATICTPRSPKCLLCPWRSGCRAHAEGIAESLPRKVPKQAKPIRLGIAWIVIDNTQRVLTVRRPDRGLLGGMLALPSSDWAETLPEDAPPVKAAWAEMGEVRHTFTHFHLRLAVRLTRVQDVTAIAPPTYETHTIQEAEAAMPTVFAKVCRLARDGAAPSTDR
ncbi:MAG: A/G-specific adenine glycosylase [Pseudomonadota bacterium]